MTESDLIDWEVEVMDDDNRSMMEGIIPPGLNNHMKKIHEITQNESNIDTKRDEPSKKEKEESKRPQADPETIEYAQRKLAALRAQNQDLARWAIHHLRQRVYELRRQIEQNKMRLDVMNQEMEELENGAEAPMSEHEKRDACLKFARSRYNTCVYNMFASFEKKHTSSENLNLVTESELRRVKLKAYDAELSRKIEEALYEKSESSDLHGNYNGMVDMFPKHRIDDADDFIQSVVDQDPTLWSTLATTSRQNSLVKGNVTQYEHRYSMLQEECKIVKLRLKKLYDRVLRGSVNPLLRYALATHLRTSVSILMAAANSPPGPKRIAFIRTLNENLLVPQLEHVSKIRWEASLTLIRKDVENKFQTKIEEETRESRKNHEAIVKLYVQG